jgi:hypothetical protein
MPDWYSKRLVAVKPLKCDCPGPVQASSGVASGNDAINAPAKAREIEVEF